MDKLKAKLLEAMNQRDFKFDDLMKIIFEEVKQMQETIESQQDDLMKNMSVELEQRDKIKELKNTVLELEVGNQKNIKKIESWMNISSNLNKLVKDSYWDLIWAERE